MSGWYLIPSVSASMPFQMAFDEILFRPYQFDDLPASVLSFVEKVREKPILRFYYSDGPWTTIGYMSKKEELVCQDERWLCRRITGGGEVQHGKDLIFSVIARKDHDESFSSVRMSYLKIHEALKTSLEDLGIASDFYRCDENLPRGPQCFSFPIATDLRSKNYKIAGGAQKRAKDSLLHQESIQVAEKYHAKLEKNFVSSLEQRFDMKVQVCDMIPEFYQAAERYSQKYEMNV